MTTETQTGTLLADGIEYNEYPPPQLLLKAMEKQWAKKLIEVGLVRVNNLEYYRRWENEHLGDPNDGMGLFHSEGGPMQIDSMNEIYAWCLFLPEISSARLCKIAENSYDCTVTIHSPEELFRRMQKYLLEHEKDCLIHCGTVNYNRGIEVDGKCLNSQKYNFNVFQKGQRFQDDKEYRVSIVNHSFKQRQDDYLELILGDCTDIISVQPLCIKQGVPG